MNGPNTREGVRTVNKMKLFKSKTGTATIIVIIMMGLLFIVVKIFLPEEKN